jgi:DNA topoisomerase I
MQLKKISHQKYLKIHEQPALTAEAGNLVYVNDTSDGIKRLKKGTGFSYLFKKSIVKNKEVISRIHKLAIPPAWENVWICNIENGHLQATGFDARQRKQYRYHVLWNCLRSETKFHHLLEFGKVIPQLRLQLKKDMSINDITEKKVLATVISLMERTYIRIGNESYEKENGSFGLSTLKDRHVEIKGDTINFSFKGKKSVHHNIALKNKKLAKAVKDCRDIPGKNFFNIMMQMVREKKLIVVW